MYVAIDNESNNYCKKGALQIPLCSIENQPVLYISLKSVFLTAPVCKK